MFEENGNPRLVEQFQKRLFGLGGAEAGHFAYLFVELHRHAPDGALLADVGFGEARGGESPYVAPKYVEGGGLAHSLGLHRGAHSGGCAPIYHNVEFPFGGIRALFYGIIVFEPRVGGCRGGKGVCAAAAIARAADAARSDVVISFMLRYAIGVFV